MKKMILLFAFALAMGWGFSQTQNALDFDGNDDFIQLDSSNSYFTNAPFTIETWFRTDVQQGAWGGNEGRLVDFHRGSDAGSSIILYTAGSNEIGFWYGLSGSGNYTLIHNANYHDNIWHHVAATHDGTTATLFYDGIQVAQQTSTSFIGNGSYPAILGTFSLNYGTRNYDGVMDETRIWNTARTQSQIQHDMYHELDNPTAETNLVGYYQFNQTSGSTLPDICGNGLDGTLTNMDPSTDWVASTAPIPYYTIADGYWFSAATWPAEQGPPAATSTWVRVEINNNISIPFGGATIEQATINPSGTITMTGSSNFINVNGDLLIRSDATGTGSVIYPSGSVSYGTATVERYYTGSEWHFISSPISDAVSGMFTGLYLQYLDESATAPDEYVDIVGTNVPLNAMQGYALWNDNTATASFTGTLNEGAQSISLAKTNLGWNLVGNPYPSSIDWDAATGWSKTNVNNATYVHVDNGTWASYVGGVGANGGTRYIAPGQGFLVECNSNPGALGMNDTVRVNNPTVFFKESVSNLVRLEVSGNGYADETVIRFTDEATTTFDGDFDAHKIFGGEPLAAQLYSFGNTPLSINSLPETETVALGLKTGVNGTYTISATEINDLSTVYLTDQETGITTDLSTDSYSFQAQFGEVGDRFIVHFAPLAINDNALTTSSIYSSANTIYLNLDAKGEYKVFSITGQIVKEGSVAEGMNTIEVDGTGNYIVQVVTAENAIAKKVILK